MHSTSVPLLLIAVGSVGFPHSILPEELPARSHPGVNEPARPLNHPGHAAHGHRLDRDQRTARDLGAILDPFGAAASSDLTILPIFLDASTIGLTAVGGVLAVFSLVTPGTFVALT